MLEGACVCDQGTRVGWRVEDGVTQAEHGHEGIAKATVKAGLLDRELMHGAGLEGLEEKGAGISGVAGNAPVVRFRLFEERTESPAQSVPRNASGFMIFKPLNEDNRTHVTKVTKG